MAYSMGSIRTSALGRIQQLPYYFTTTDDSGTTSPLSISTTAMTLYAPTKAVALRLHTVNPVYFKDTATVTSSGGYLESNATIDIPVYPGATVYLVKATGTEATVTTVWLLNA